MSTTTAAAAAKMTSTTAVAVSLVLSSCVIANAFRQKKQFYPSVVYICKSNPSMAIMYMQALVAVYLIGKLTGKLFFGSLRPAESERLIEKAWYAVTETCLAFTIFKDDLSPKFVALFTLLLFLKCFHWLAEDRVDYMERTPVISYIFHLRIWLLLFILTLGDLYFVHDAYTTTMAKGPSVQLVFGFEYALLVTLAANAGFKYVLHAVDVHSDTFWESKAVLLLYLEFFIGLCKAVMYVVFLIIMVRSYTIPLFAFRPMYHTLRNFKKVFQDLVLSRRAIHNMNTLYPDATLQDLQAIENVCIICREDMTAAAAKKLPCNHIFHTSCLRSWFQRHQTCPTCRLDILRPTPSTTQNVNVPAPPTPNIGRTVQEAPSTDAAASSSATDNSRGPNASNHTNVSPGQAGTSGSSYYNQTPLQYQFRPCTFQQRSTSIDEINGNNNDNSNSGIPEPNNMNESWIAFMNAAGLGGGIGLPSLFNDIPQTSSNLPFTNIPRIPLNLPFVGGIAIQPPNIPPNLDTLTDEELRLMEQNTRQGCLARIKYITDIKCMLDAAVVMMNQYSSACLVAGLDSTDSTLNSETKTADTTENDDQSETRSPSNISSETDCSGGVTSSSGSGSGSGSGSSEDQLLPEETEQQRIIRLKRLEKFGSNSV
ncbi:E3 ubiquitin-protein ligase synoviolin B-like isoform X2 [Rhopalosiphum maidis]|uniref:E3 ubiquitin-protein ligase synoviolin B-like isoform X2 n=1 Tax=Rhopalosiphum maidis TaxID=43146 RepID=UPI000EFF31E6|nr:E3 ubiquitin-protein ligase synoviolin B-like isoform X2 [Rhopalosiphum maidis]